ncbi:MAG: response regulator [Clostridia bacterium]|nr:response regulator [Clostridia bacterium]
MLNKDTKIYILGTLKHMKTQISDIEDKIMEEELVINPIFQNKKAIIGNYDSFSSNELRKILESFGMNVEIFKTGSEILEKIEKSYKCDVIFTNNVYRYGIQGPELLKELRQLQNFNTPIIIHTIDKDRRLYYVDNLGFDEYIAKPIFANDNEKILEVKTILEKFIK